MSLASLLIAAACSRPNATAADRLVPAGADAPEQTTASGDGEEPQRDVDAPSDAYAAFAAVEARLLAAPAIDLRFHVESSGAFPSVLEGQLILEPASATELSATGMFGGETADVNLSADEQQLEYRTAAKAPVKSPRPADLDGSLLVGLTRMGLLHNLAMLVAGSAPERTDGSVDQWVRVSAVSWGDTAPVDGRPARALHFDLVVDGQPSGKATLWIDEASGLPGRREQHVDFGEQTMDVIEVYDWIEPAP